MWLRRDGFKVAADGRPVEKDDLAVMAVRWCSLLSVQSSHHLMPVAGAWLQWGLVCVLRCNELDVVRWVILVENGDIKVQCSCNGIQDGCGGLQVIHATVSEDGCGVGASAGVAGQLWSYAAVLSSEALWVQWVSRVAQQRALQHGCHVVCGGSTGRRQTGFTRQGLPTLSIQCSFTIPQVVKAWEDEFRECGS